jgi:hypothetical protein
VNPVSQRSVGDVEGMISTRKLKQKLGIPLENKSKTKVAFESNRDTKRDGKTDRTKERPESQ